MSHTCRYANKLRELASAIPRGILAMCFLLRSGLFVSQGGKRAGNDVHAFGAGAPAEERARHVISRHVKTKTTRDYSVLNFLPKVKNNSS